MDISNREKNNLEKIYPFLSECTLFLKCDHNFPLASPCSIAAYGRGVRHTIKGGTGSGDVNSRFFINIEDALISHGFNIVSKDWLDYADEIYPLEKKKWIKDIKKEAKEYKMLSPIYAIGKAMREPNINYPLNYDADAAIYVVSRISGEGSDREFKQGDILLTDTEIRDILDLNSRYKKFMLVINAGGVVDLSPVLEVRNILLLSELGAEVGNVFTDILLGKMNPSGKLTATWGNIDDYPYEKKIPLHDTYYKEGKYVGYRYFDSFLKEPLFPFGYGLSYTKFKIDNFSISHNKENIEIKADVENIGHFKGKEVVQAYISYLGKEESAYQELISFSKTKEISPKEKDTVSLNINLRNIAKYDKERALYFLHSGEYLIRIGNSSKDTVDAFIIELSEEIIFKEAENIYEKDEIEEIKPLFKKEKPLNLHKISLNQMDFETIPYVEEEIIVPEEIKRLSTEDLVYMNIGYVAKKGSISFVGESSRTAPGAAGEASSEFAYHFHNKIVMADGPAGIRLTKSYYKKGNKIKKLELNAFLVEAIEFLPWLIKVILKAILLKRKNTDKIDKIYHQYCTAIPIATAIGQSFNCDLAYVAGDIVGSEMEEFDIDLWLAPAMNIQRTIMCGRNFEYYSEDPLLTGIMASYISNGVQSHKGKGVVIKHFVANNQETFRYVSNSVINEATIREIYLRGYEICLREAHPMGVMSSYNLVNGIHTSEDNSLIHKYLYNENNFKGVVMTDWVMKGSKPKLAKYDIAHVERVYKASTSLFMPGSKYDIKQLQKELKKYPENRRLLEINATRLYKNFSK